MKTINKYFKIACVAVSMIVIASCSDFLDQENPNAATTNTFGYKLTDVQKEVVAVYNAFRQPNLYGLADNVKRTDLVLPGKEWESSSDVMYNQTFTNTNQTAANQWEYLYKGVFRANQAIMYSNRMRSSLTSDAMQEAGLQCEAQAKFFRGLFYFWLANTFNNGSVPYFDYVPYEETDFYQALRPANEIITLYRKDLEFAYNNLPENYSDDADMGRVTKWAAAAILGKSYLYEKDYTTAAKYFKAIIDSGQYYLGDADGNQTTKGEFGPESILEISYTTQYNTEYGVWSSAALHNIYNNYSGGNGGWNTWYPSAWLTEAFENEDIDPMLQTEDNAVESILEPKFIDVDGNELSANVQGTTLRITENGKIINYTSSKTFDHLDYMQIPALSKRASATMALSLENTVPYYFTIPNAYLKNNAFARFKLYSNCYSVASERDLEPSGMSAVNVRLVRLADVYLMYAECLIKGGTDDGGLFSALKYVNKVRKRAGVILKGECVAPNDEYNGTATYQTTNDDDLIDSAEKLMNHLMYVERPLELNIEGYNIRFMDLRRWGILKQRFQELSAQEHRYAYYSSYGVDYGGTTLSINGNPCPQMTANTNYAHPVLYDPDNMTDAEISQVADQKSVYNYQSAAINFTNEENAYFPIPSKELISNPAIIATEELGEEADNNK